MKMRHIIAGLALSLIAILPAQAQTVVVPDCAATGLVYGSTNNPQGRPYAIDTTGRVCTDAGGTGTAADQVQGNSANNATDIGNPVKVGGVGASAAPTAVTTGNRVNGWFTLNGGMVAGMPVFTSIDGVANAAITSPAQPGSASTWSPMGVASTVFNGSTWDRQFVCNNTAVINVTAGSTTELVALTASQIIRVCSFTVAMSAAGTAQFVYGTGVNCATGTVNITGAVPLATGTPWAQTGASGLNIFRTIASNALCLAAVTGNAVGFVTYAKF